MRKEIKITTTSVYDARALAELVGVANGYTSRIFLDMDGRQINAKSIMGIMGIGLDVDKSIVIDAQGDDELDAIRGIEDFLTK